jgi:2-polyprenyl-3-methyl-5-hydroxy-6-metoxy-1,4-benzoquinol methylase
MPEPVSSCPLCGSAISQIFDQRSFHSQPVTNVICRRCGLVYQSPRMTETERQAFYQAEYRLLYQGQEGPSPKDLAVQSARARLVRSLVTRRGISPVRLLDIGCSSGLLLQEFQDHFHSQAIGIEPGTGYRQHAQAHGLTVYSSLEELRLAGLLPFDLVSMMHVLEHMPDPVEYLQHIREMHLEPGGWLLLEVPNLYAHNCFEVAHLVSFSPHALKQVVQKAGYQVVQLHAHGKPRSDLIPLYLTLLAQPAVNQPFVLKSDRLVRSRRQFGFFHRRLVTRLFPARAWVTPG